MATQFCNFMQENITHVQFRASLKTIIESDSWQEGESPFQLRLKAASYSYLDAIHSEEDYRVSDINNFM